MFVRLSLLLVLLGFAITPAMAASSGKWHSATVDGYKSYWTVNNSGARFTLWCPLNSAEPLPLISIGIKGKMPAPKSLIRVELDHRLIKFTAARDGYIRPDCRACGDNLNYFWQLLRRSGRFAVLLQDRRFAGFSTRGARDILPPTMCADKVARAE